MTTATIPADNQSATLSRRSVNVIEPPEGHDELRETYDYLVSKSQAIDAKRKEAIRLREDYRQGIEDDPLNADCEALASRLRADENELLTMELHLRTKLDAYLVQLAPILEQQRRAIAESRAALVEAGAVALAKAGFDCERFRFTPMTTSMFVKDLYTPCLDADRQQSLLSHRISMATEAISKNQGSIRHLREVIKTAALKRAELV